MYSTVDVRLRVLGVRRLFGSISGERYLIAVRVLSDHSMNFFPEKIQQNIND